MRSGCIDEVQLMPAAATQMDIHGFICQSRFAIGRSRARNVRPRLFFPLYISVVVVEFDCLFAMQEMAMEVRC